MDEKLQVDKSNYCIHGMTLQEKDDDSCICCGRAIPWHLRKISKFCEECMKFKPKRELI